LSREPGQIRDFEVRNCSISEIILEERGPGEFIKMGDWSHIIQAYEEDTNDCLEDSTAGGV
jgi:hypothetical protein